MSGFPVPKNGGGDGGGVTPAELNARYRYNPVSGDPWLLATRPDGTAWVSATVNYGGDVAVNVTDSPNKVWWLQGSNPASDTDWILIGKGTPEWGDIIGSITNQTDLVDALALKQDVANITQDISADQASTTKYPSAKAVWDFAAMALMGLLKIGSQNPTGDGAGFIDCSGNPNYPSAVRGEVYFAILGGRIGGGSGEVVDATDMIVCTVDNAGGTEASVGTSWTVMQGNVVGALMAANNLSDLTNAATARANLGITDYLGVGNSGADITGAYPVVAADSGKMLNISGGSTKTISVDAAPLHAAAIATGANNRFACSWNNAGAGVATFAASGAGSPTIVQMNGAAGLTAGVNRGGTIVVVSATLIHVYGTL